MALAQSPSEPADHVAHHPDQQAGQITPQMQSNPQMTGGCPNMGNMMGQMPMMGQGMMALA
jgi:hypothetical protein